MEHGTQEILRKIGKIDAPAIIQAAIDMMDKS